MTQLFLFIAAVCIAFPLALCVVALLAARCTRIAAEWVLFRAGRALRRVFTLVCVLCLGALISSPPCATAAGTVFLGGKGLADGSWTPAFLASAEATDSEAGKAVRIFFYVAGGFMSIAVGYAQLFRRKPSLDTELSKFATQAEMKATHTEIAAVREEMHQTELRIEGKMQTHFTALDHKRSVSIGNLHTRLSDVAQTLDKEIADIPAKVIRLLKDTGNIGKGGPK